MTRWSLHRVTSRVHVTGTRTVLVTSRMGVQQLPQHAGTTAPHATGAQGAVPSLAMIDARGMIAVNATAIDITKAILFIVYLLKLDKATPPWSVLTERKNAEKP